MNYFVQFHDKPGELCISWVLHVGFGEDFQDSLESFMKELEKRSGTKWVCRTVKPFEPYNKGV